MKNEENHNTQSFFYENFIFSKKGVYLLAIGVLKSAVKEKDTNFFTYGIFRFYEQLAGITHSKKYYLDLIELVKAGKIR